VVPMKSDRYAAANRCTIRVYIRPLSGAIKLSSIFQIVFIPFESRIAFLLALKIKSHSTNIIKTRPVLMHDKHIPFKIHSIH